MFFFSSYCRIAFARRANERFLKIKPTKLIIILNFEEMQWNFSWIERTVVPSTSLRISKILLFFRASLNIGVDIERNVNVIKIIIGLMHLV